jgi:hypothetical protein
MARTIPEYLPHQENASNLEYQVLQALRLLPEMLFVFCSKKLKEVSQHKGEFGVDFLVFDGLQNLLCSEAKEGDIVYDRIPDVWYRIPREHAEYVENDSLGFDTIVVDEERDFKPVWFEILEEYSSSHFVTVYDEIRNLFAYLDDIPWGAAMVPRKALARNCRNTRLIANQLSLCIGAEVDAFESSPLCQSVTTRIFPDLIAQREARITELTHSMNGGAEPSRIIIFIDNKPQNTGLGNSERIGNLAIEDVGCTYRQRPKSNRSTNAKLIKEMKADVIIVLRETLVDLDVAECFVACSRATTLPLEDVIASAH